MADTTKISIGLIGLLIVGGLGAYLLTPEQLNRASTCTTTNITGIFEKFSATNVTAYWTVNGVLKQSVCTKGKWIPTLEWLKINGLTPKDVTINSVNESELTEDGVVIVSAGETIIISQSQIISVEGKEYNVTYVPKVTVKCICERSGCKISECLP